MSSRACIDPYQGPTVEGIDVSHHQGTIHWDRVAASGIGYAIIRTGDGLEYIDRQFERNWKEAWRVGIRRGSYQYFRAPLGGQAQADLFVQQIRAAGGYGSCDLPPVLDIEEKGQGGLPIETVLAESKAWLDHVERALKRRPMIYTGQYWHWKVSQPKPQLGEPFGRYPLWVPSYGTSCARMPCTTSRGPAPWAKWTLWQYTNRGDVDGINTPVDVNRFQGDDKALARFAADSKTGAMHFLAGLIPLAGALTERC